MKYKQVHENEWQQPVPKNYLMKCCDCGLVHEMDFRIAYGNKKKDNRVQLRARRKSPKLKVYWLYKNQIYKRRPSCRFDDMFKNAKPVHILSLLQPKDNK